MSNKGKTKIFVNGEWVDTKYENVKMGDIYRIYKNNGHIAKNKKGKFVWLAVGDCGVVYKSEITTRYHIPNWPEITPDVSTYIQRLKQELKYKILVAENAGHDHVAVKVVDFADVHFVMDCLRGLGWHLEYYSAAKVGREMVFLKEAKYEIVYLVVGDYGDGTFIESAFTNRPKAEKRAKKLDDEHLKAYGLDYFSGYTVCQVVLNKHK